jgi:hypothetical protein
MVLLLAGAVPPAFLDARAAASSVTGEIGRGFQAGEFAGGQADLGGAGRPPAPVAVEREISPRLYEAHPIGPSQALAGDRQRGIVA